MVYQTAHSRWACRGRRVHPDGSRRRRRRWIWDTFTAKYKSRVRPINIGTTMSPGDSTVGPYVLGTNWNGMGSSGGGTTTGGTGGDTGGAGGTSADVPDVLPSAPPMKLHAATDTHTLQGSPLWGSANTLRPWTSTPPHDHAGMMVTVRVADSGWNSTCVKAKPLKARRTAGEENFGP